MYIQRSLGQGLTFLRFLERLQGPFLSENFDTILNTRVPNEDPEEEDVY